MPAQNDVEMQYQSAEPMDANKPSPSSSVSLAPESKYRRRSLTLYQKDDQSTESEPKKRTLLGMRGGGIIRTFDVQVFC